MTKTPKRPDESELLAFLDEELTAERQAEVRRLLGHDWELRAQLAKLERRIEQYVDATASQPSVATPSVDHLWEDFSGRLAETTNHQTAQPGIGSSRRPPAAGLFNRFRTQFQMRGRLRLAIGASTSLLVVSALALALLRAERTVSAQELLQRTAQAEAANLSRVGDPVVYRRVQLRRLGARETLTWESWNDARRNQFRQRVSDGQGLRYIRGREKTNPVILGELERIYEANHLDLQRPLSAVAYADWHKRVRRKSETVTETVLPGGGTGLKLTTIAGGPYAGDAIVEASLIVRRADWHAVAQQLRVQGEGEIREYELSETGYEVVPMEALTVFADLSPATSPNGSDLSAAPLMRSRVVVSPSPALNPAPTEAALQEAEVAALYALHQLQADLGEQIEVARETNHRIIVRGMVETAARKQQLINALSGVSLVDAQIQTVEEAIRRAQQNRPETTIAFDEARTTGATLQAITEDITASGGRAVSSANSFQQKLVEHFGGRAGLNPAEQKAVARNVAQFYNAVESDASSALAEAWAMRRLQERFASPIGADLNPATQQRIEEMFGDHIKRLRRHARNLHTRLQSALGASASDAPTFPFGPAIARQARVQAIFRVVEQVSRLSDRLINAAGDTNVSTLQTASALLLELTRLDASLASIEAESVK